MFKIVDREVEAKTKLVKSLVKRFGKSFDISVIEDRIACDQAFLDLQDYYYTPWSRWPSFASVMCSLNGFSYSKTQRVVVTTACDLFLFDIVKK